MKTLCLFNAIMKIEKGCRELTRKMFFLNNQFLILLISLFTFFLFIQSSCKKKPLCEGVTNISATALAVTFVDSASGNYLYLENPFRSPYNKDSLEIFHEDGSRAFIEFSLNQISGTSSRYYNIIFSPICNKSSDCIANQMEKIKFFYIQYYNNSRDTLTLKYKTSSNICGDYFIYLNISYRNKIIASFNNTTITQMFTIRKP